MKVLLCSAGRRVKLVSYFKEELNKIGGMVIAVDCDNKAPALYSADAYEIVPHIEHCEYLQTIKGICKKYQIDAVLSLIDPELSLLASNIHEFEKENIKIIISNKEVVNTCYDKYLTFTFLQENELPCISTYINSEDVEGDLLNGRIRFPLIVKPRKGSASIGIHKVNSLNELNGLFERYKDLIVQPFIDGDEYGVDCYIDLLTKQATNIFIKRKIKMRAGETDKSIAVKDKELMNLVEKLINTLKPIGPVDIDCFKTKAGYIISEINPRFGGGYPHAHELGQNFPGNIINNLKGLSNTPQIGNYEEGSILIKFDSHQIIHEVG
ncbi:ATP-grasp domain-containing protein [Cytobacillus massiliigabonensis]|uniref:ATP-grasp domain-containing protein n=1 Tax=Cytobacillus massiliigabonensis TaxID=1871011 RepID=UPI000C867CBD|nr:ATP-grasp domain-containing protein [Cytobacillus massiliigabonensis]